MPQLLIPTEAPGAGSLGIRRRPSVDQLCLLECKDVVPRRNVERLLSMLVHALPRESEFRGGCLPMTFYRPSWPLGSQLGARTHHLGHLLLEGCKPQAGRRIPYTSLFIVGQGPPMVELGTTHVKTKALILFLISFICTFQSRPQSPKFAPPPRAKVAVPIDDYVI